MAEPVCVISGVGPGTGTALVRRFAAGGCRIAMLARTAERLADLAAEVPSAKAYVCDVSDQSQVDSTMALVEREMGAPSVLIPPPTALCLGPKGVHVAYIVIDAVIDVPWARERFKTKPDDFFIAPAAIADEAWHVANQPRSAWSFNVEVRPYGETW